MKQTAFSVGLGLILTCALAGASEYRVNDFGAKGDDSTPATAAIQNAIDAAAKSGGSVVFAPGIYRTGSLFLKSGVHFRIDKGVELRGSQGQSDYPVMPTRIAGIEMSWPAALINVYEQSTVKISGEGVIDGDGKQRWDRYWVLRREYEPKGLRWASDYDTRCAVRAVSGPPLQAPTQLLWIPGGGDCSLLRKWISERESKPRRFALTAATLRLTSALATYPSPRSSGPRSGSVPPE